MTNSPAQQLDEEVNRPVLPGGSNIGERRRAEERRIRDLLTRVERWKLSQDIRAYVKGAMQVSGYSGEDLSWALLYADELDPLVQMGDEDV